MHHRGGFQASDNFAHRALAAGPAETQQALLSERELTVLGLLPSMLSLHEIAADLSVSVNTVKSHLRSIYAGFGVSSRRFAVLAALRTRTPQQHTLTQAAVTRSNTQPEQGRATAALVEGRVRLAEEDRRGRAWVGRPTLTGRFDRPRR